MKASRTATPYSLAICSLENPLAVPSTANADPFLAYHGGKQISFRHLPTLPSMTLQMASLYRLTHWHHYTYWGCRRFTHRLRPTCRNQGDGSFNARVILYRNNRPSHPQRDGLSHVNVHARRLGTVPMNLHAKDHVLAFPCWKA